LDDVIERGHKADTLASEILHLSRNTLMIHLRFLDAALIQVVPVPETDLRDLATDGRQLFYNPWHVLDSYKNAKEIPVRDYLHATLHCVFRHIFVGRRIHAEVWDLACDITVENIITHLGIKAVSCPREEYQTELTAKLREEIQPLTAEKLYRYFLDQQLTADEYSRLRRTYYADDHEGWYIFGEDSADASDSEDAQDETDASGEDASGTSPADGEDLPDADNAPNEEDDVSGKFTGEETDAGNGEADSGRQSEQKGDTPSLERDTLEQKWKEIGERIDVDLETSNDTWGQAAGDMIQMLKSVNRERYDYAEFLKRFAVLGENIEVNDDEFDYIFYTYGLKLYNNMPFVEPLEYKEIKRIREFVIALDTSQSVAGDLVQKFVTKTYNILKQTDNFFTKTNIHIIQCGAAVHEDAKITTPDEFDTYIAGMKLYGFGGTDFRPVFEYVNCLITGHEFTNFKGLIYFTDGYGTFPFTKPGYDAVFVFVNDEGEIEIPDIPVWAIKLVLSPEEIELF
jgi:predicted metal-dependent peptidase